jgi:hypothetical protein
MYENYKRERKEKRKIRNTKAALKPYSLGTTRIKKNPLLKARVSVNQA